MKINACPSDNLNEVFRNAKPHDCVLLSSGVYHQKVQITTPFLTIEGQNSDNTVITFDDCANKIHADGKQFNTFRTYTVAVCADNVKMKNLTIENSTTEPKINGQCVALSVVAKNFEMSNCKLKSTQDTLFCGPLPDDLIERYTGFLQDNLLRKINLPRQVFSHCQIFGSVDFIFGCGNAIFDNCRIVSVNDGREVGFVCAPAHDKDVTQGFEFANCQFEAEANVATQSVFLARPWRDFGKCHFANCKFGSHINSLGFDKWNDTNRDKTARFSVENCTQLTNLVSWAKKILAVE